MSGQKIAIGFSGDPVPSTMRALGCHVISAASINPTGDAVFNTGTPLIYYVLTEAHKAHQTLGCVGQNIVAQTFIRVLWDT